MEKLLKGKFFNRVEIQEEVHIPPEIINHLKQKWQEELKEKIKKIATPPCLIDEEITDERNVAIQEGAKLGFDYVIEEVLKLLK
jgi:hypothetical protein